MTGANRLLIGAGWPFLVLLWWLRTRRPTMEIHRERRIEIGYLALATMYAFVLLLTFKKSLSLVDTFFFLAIFGAYVWRTGTGAHVEPELVGPSEAMAQLRPFLRRSATVALFGYSAFVILLSTKPFAESLLGIGRQFGIDEFLLVQWVAPLASEAPEFAVAAIFAVRLQADMALGTLLSSKLNQWTLLVGTLAATYSISAGRPALLPLDGRQLEEVMLTAAQSVFALVALAELRLSLAEALLLFCLFFGQLLTPSMEARYFFAAAYLVLALFWLLFDPAHRHGCFASVAEALSFRRK
jgi:cation:H+ antiporter